MSPPGSRGERPEPLLDAAGTFAPPTVLVDFDSSEWNDVARRHGGSANTLLVAVVVGVLRASGRVSDGESVKVSLPVSLRRDNDPRANATSGVSIVVDGGDAARRDLSPIRDRMKSAFVAASDPSVLGYLAPLRQMLPDRAIRAIAGTPSARSAVFQSRIRFPGVQNCRRTRRAIGGYAVDCAGSGPRNFATQQKWYQRLLNNSGDVVTLCVTGLDPDSFPEQRVLSSLVSAECRRWKLTPEIW